MSLKQIPQLEKGRIRQKISINSKMVTADLTDFFVYLDLSKLGGIFFRNVRPDGKDIIITEDDGVTELPVEVESIDKVNSTGGLHFRVNFLSSTTDINFYIYYRDKDNKEYSEHNFNNTVNLEEANESYRKDFTKEDIVESCPIPSREAVCDQDKWLVDNLNAWKAKYK